ncbi:GlcNAc-transferase family protein [Bordetella sp. H567]|uniref:GlcNAc-transferase family protein n=1 Tax=Bordetella sp. H567 TaxID=1697043 RepID=UPI00082C0469|nr:GlcNAc-transferase family protein [Bordetella sp. H567]
MSAKRIFVQIASYRDPQLIPTLVDLIEQAAQPDALRVVVCWQHAQEETLDTFFASGFAGARGDVRGQYPVHRLARAGAAIELIDVPQWQSRGACWARNLIQQRYQEEAYTLQLDSHHRFVPHWDAVLIEMLESLRTESPKPVLTTYLPAFDSRDDPGSRVMLPAVLTFFKFDYDGIILLSGRYVAESEHTRPIPVAFYSAHFAFADGAFAREVRHDPGLFFYGEEISIAVRAYTHGYDFHCPHRLVAWHQYGCDGRSTIWQDHTEEAKAKGDVALVWAERNDSARLRVRQLLGMDGVPSDRVDFAPYGLGTARSLAQYERYAGLCFARRMAHEATLDGHLPPAGDAMLDDDAWCASLCHTDHA